jgi:hypothetical protein
MDWLILLPKVENLFARLHYCGAATGPSWSVSLPIKATSVYGVFPHVSWLLPDGLLPNLVLCFFKVIETISAVGKMSKPSPKTNLKGAFLKGIWLCDCEPKLPADHFQTKNGGQNHGRWCTHS